MGIETKTKELQIFYGGAKKADWDVGMAVDAIKTVTRVDAIVLATGDGDFVPLAEYLKAHGVQVEVISFGKSSSSRLRDTVDEFIDMGEQPHKFLLTSRFSIPLPGVPGQAGHEGQLPHTGSHPDVEDDGESPQVVGSDTDEDR